MMIDKSVVREMKCMQILHCMGTVLKHLNDNTTKRKLMTSFANEHI